MLNKNTVAQAKTAAMEGRVFVTDCDKPTHVSIQDYRPVARGRKKIADLLAMPGAEDIDLDIPRFDTLAQAADLS